MRSRLAITFALVAGLAGAATADTEVVVVGPAAAGKLKGAPARHVTKALTDANVAPVDPRKLEPGCAADATCLAGLGVELGARKVVSITIERAAGTRLGLVFVLVDVADRAQLARRELKIADRTLGRELGPALTRFFAEAPVERAKALFAQGNQHYNLGEFAAALDIYKQAYKTKPLPAFLFNIAQCHRKLGQHDDAVNMYQSYLAGVPNAKNRALAESLIAESRDKLAEAQRRARDERAEDARREAARLAAETAAAEAARRGKEAEAVAAGEQHKAELARIEAERVERLERESRYGKHPARLWTYVGAVAGSGALITGGVFGFSARGAQDAYDDRACGDPAQQLDAAELAACRADRDRGKRAATMSNVLLATGGAIVALSALVFIIDPGNIERPREARARLHVSPTAVMVVVQW